MPPMKATDEQPNSDNSQLLMAGTRQMEIEELSVTAKKIDKPPMRATECACTFCTPLKSESSAGPCNRASLMTSKVNSAEATKLSKKENINFISTKISDLLYPDQAVSQNISPAPQHDLLSAHQHAIVPDSARPSRLHRIKTLRPSALARFATNKQHGTGAPEF